jgi:hypothetical protein
MYIIQVRYGGLGDHLFFSHIPRIVKEFGHKIYLSTLSEFRNFDYLNFIWMTNPYLDGTINEPGIDIGDIESRFPNDGNLLDKIMLALNLDDGKRWHEPELYYKQKNIKQKLVGKTLYDGNWISNVGTIIENLPLTDFQMSSQYKHISNGAPFIESTSLEDYCDLILTCKEFHCLNSGSATLAAALKKPSFVYYGSGQKKLFQHSKLHKYIKK